MVGVVMIHATRGPWGVLVRAGLYGTPFSGTPGGAPRTHHVVAQVAFD
jgi:hypothetical protein